MKKLVGISLLATALLLLAACSKTEQGTDTSKVQEVTPATPTTAQSIDTANLQTAFQTAPEADKTEVQNAIAAIKSGNYTVAMTSLQKVASNANLTPEQKSALQNIMNQVQAKAVDLGKKALSTSGDLQKSLPK